ncbi:MAG: hypothetical protein NTU81_00455 [Candidatus Nomurabacteria bacterium]|nr:hypothetical protein [Candidatus Nomurabacteria bacterium]
MENIKFNQNSKEKINYFLQDYSNDFWVMKIALMGGTIDSVRKLFKDGHTVPTVEKYIEKCRSEGKTTLNVEDQNDPIFIEKSIKLNEIVEKNNLLGENIKEQDVIEKVEAAMAVISS